MCVMQLSLKIMNSKQPVKLIASATRDRRRIEKRERSSMMESKKDSDTGNRTPGYRVRGDNVSHYTISDVIRHKMNLYTKRFAIFF